MASPRAHRAGDAQLTAPFGGEHDEDQEDQQAAGEDGEAAEGREERHERVALGVCCVERVLLDRVDLEPERLHDRVHDLGDLVGERGAGELVATVGDQDVLDLAFAVEKPLRGVERQQQGRAVRACALVVHDLPDRDRHCVALGVQPELVAGRGLQLLGRVAVQEDLAGLQVVQVLRRTVVVPADLAERAEVSLAAGEERHARLALPGGDALDGERLHDRRRDAVDQVLVAEQQLVLDLGEDVLGEVLDARGCSNFDLGIDVGAAHRHELVRLPERRDRRDADRVAHRVPGDERRRDDRRAEHQPEDDQRRACTTPGDVANAELQEDAVTERKRADDAYERRQGDDDRERQRLHRDAEELVHGSPYLSMPTGWSATRTA